MSSSKQSAKAANIFDRRRFLELAIASGAGAVAASSLATRASAAATVRAASAIAPAGSDLGAIEHVIFLMKENRSFDHYFGTYRGARGFDDHPKHSLGAFSQSYSGGHLLPFHLDISTGKAECTHDLTHNWLPQHECWNTGAMDSFAKIHSTPKYEGPTYGPLTMGYFTRADIPYYYTLADAFTLCDGYHCSVMAPTHPNRLMAVSGTLDPGGHHGGPVLITNSSPDAKFSVDWPTMPEVLEDAGVSWKVYSPPGEIYRATFDEVVGITDSVFPYFKQYSNPQSALWKKAFNPTYPTDFLTDLKNGALPKVSWLIPPIGYDEHPPSPPALGEWYTDQLLKTLVAHPKIWAKTVIFHMYDENDGFFDHVPPPTPPKGTAGEYVTAHPLPPTAEGNDGPIGLGFRVPLLVLSPFSRGGYICSDTFDHTSQLRFLEERFGVKAPNISNWRRKTVGDLTTTLHMKKSDTSKFTLPSTVGYTKTALKSLGCTTTDFVELGTKQPVYPIPSPQTMPVQEPGRARRLTSRIE